MSITSQNDDDDDDDDGGGGGRGGDLCPDSGLQRPLHDHVHDGCRRYHVPALVVPPGPDPGPAAAAAAVGEGEDGGEEEEGERAAAAAATAWPRPTVRSCSRVHRRKGKEAAKNTA
ncbi:hypothetical protein PGQ11_014781 [Apiospora arundinis]|uniref:Uncharacterized protein n=1 Tax=Apiospora arundinis TaxID=335852 RepID=A0ABR2HTE3_9PEZI